MGKLISLADCTKLSFSSRSMNIILNAVGKIDIDWYASSKVYNVFNFPHSVCWAESSRNLPKSAIETQL